MIGYEGLVDPSPTTVTDRAERMLDMKQQSEEGKPKEGNLETRYFPSLL